MTEQALSAYSRQNPLEEPSALSLSTSLSSDGSRKGFSREGSCSSFEDSCSAKKRPILKKTSSFAKRKRGQKTGRKISFKPELAEVFEVESFKAFNVDMSEFYDFMGLQCQKTNCQLF